MSRRAAPPAIERRAIRWTVSAGLIAAAWALNLGYMQLTGSTNPFTLFYPAFIASALLCGRAPAYASLMAAAAIASAYWLSPVGEPYALDVGARWSLAGFVACSALMIETALRGVDAARRLQAQSATLDTTLQRLRVSEASRSVAMTLGQLAAWEHDPRSGRSTWDDRLAALLGVPLAELPDWQPRWLELVHPDDRARIQSAVAAAVSDRGAYREVFRVRRVDGETRWFEAAGQSVVDEAAADHRMVGYVQDITSRVLAEQAMADRQAELRSALDGLQAAVLLVDVLPGAEPFRIRVANRSARAWDALPPGSGASPSHGPDAATAAAPVAFESARALWRLAVATGEPTSGEQHLPLAVGPRWVYTTVTPLKDARGEIRQLVSTSLDVTARKEAELALAAQARLMQLATEAGGVGTWELDFRANANRISETAAALLGTTVRDYSADGWATFVHPDDRSRVAEAWRQTVDHDAPYDIEYRSAAPASDGSERWFLVRGMVERDLHGRPARALGVLVDVSARRRVDAALREAERRFRVRTARSSS